MSLYFAQGSETTALTDQDLQAALSEVFSQLGQKQKVIALPPDFTRYPSQAGKLTCMVHDYYGSKLTDVMPALGTHDPMKEWQLEKMFPTLPKHLIREHRWRTDVETVGEVPADFVEETTGGIWNRPWPAQLNKLVWSGGHDLIVSLGQVVPHEVIGMANYNKNIFVGTGGVRGINESHFISAAYGLERTMGRTDTPLRRILNFAQDHFCNDLPLLYVLTVIETDENGEFIVRGLFVGDDVECFERAAELSLKVNFTVEQEEPKTVVAYLDPEEFHSTWLGNKAIYRTRLLIADGGELIILAPGVNTFGEDADIDRLIRKYGYVNTPEVMRLVEENEDLKGNLSAAAHLIHGTSDGRFKITYCTEELTQPEIESVGYNFGDLSAMMDRFNPEQLKDGWNEVDGRRIYFVRNPALGLWASSNRIPWN